jgi:hypothetical protein
MKDMLAKNPKSRPSINTILSSQIFRNQITKFLNESVRINEFSHTVIHGANMHSNPPPPLSSLHNMPSNRLNANPLNPSSVNIPVPPRPPSSIQKIIVQPPVQQQQQQQSQQQPSSKKVLIKNSFHNLSNHPPLSAALALNRTYSKRI